MKKFGTENNQTIEQEYSGLTITELENKLITEEPESGIQNVFYAVMRWGRLLIVLSLAVIFIYGACYVHGLKEEIRDLRKELNSQAGGITEEVNAGKNQPAVENPPIVSQAENTGQNQPAVKTPPGGPEATPQNEFIIYSIQSGDNLSKISSMYYGNEDFAPYLAELNGIPADSQLNVGQEIKVPEKPYESWTAEDR